MPHVARTFDVAGRDARNRALGGAGKDRVLAHERAMLHGAGRADLAGRVRWVAEEDGDGAGYDIASFAPDGAPRLIEVKTTNGWERTPFHITRHELAVARDRPGKWCLLRLWNFAREPGAFELRPPLEVHVTRVATAFEARFSCGWCQAACLLPHHRLNLLGPGPIGKGDEVGRPLAARGAASGCHLPCHQLATTTATEQASTAAIQDLVAVDLEPGIPAVQHVGHLRIVDAARIRHHVTAEIGQVGQNSRR